MSGRQLISSNTPWERLAGYSRAVRAGPALYVSGTTASDEQGQTVFPGDAYRQTAFILQRIRGVLESAGARLHDVVRTRIFITDYANWEMVARAHGEAFAEIRPANSLVVVSSLVPRDALVEIEADAVIAYEIQPASQ